MEKDGQGVARERAAQIRFPAITPKRIIMDLSLTCVVATPLWQHIYLGGGLCDLPTWTPTPIRERDGLSLDLGAAIAQPPHTAPAR
jgi:asparagine synthase (glutamine-hydrolysing)